MKQATTRLRQRAVRFAQHRARLVEYNGGRGDAAYVEDTVEDVFVDTLSGVLAWDPAKGKLSAHIFLALRSRIRHDMDRAEAQPHASIEALDETLLEVESALAETTPASNAEDAMLCAQIIAQVRARAADDPGISKLLDGMCTGHLDRGALMRATGMSARDYDATRKRLDRLLAELPLNGARRVRPDQCHDHIDAD